jgi:uncharacterized membrane protein
VIWGMAFNLSWPLFPPVLSSSFNILYLNTQFMMGISKMLLALWFFLNSDREIVGMSFGEGSALSVLGHMPGMNGS